MHFLCCKVTWLHCALIISVFRTELGSFLNFICWFLIFAKAFRNSYVTDCSIARRSAAEKKELSGYGTAPFLAKKAQHSSTAVRLNASEVTRLVATEQVRNKHSLLKSPSSFCSYLWKLFDIVIFTSYNMRIDTWTLRINYTNYHNGILRKQHVLVTWKNLRKT